MTRLEWGQGPRLFDLGVDRGVLYLDNTAVPWNGLVSVDEKASGLVNADYYFEGNRLHVSQETGDFEARISAFTYPDVFGEYNGYSERKTYQRFGFSYRTQHGDGHKLHLVYNVLVRNDTRSWDTLTNAANPSLFQWDISAAAIPVPGASPAARLIMEVPSDEYVFAQLEDILYGSETTEPRLPDPEELVSLYESAVRLRIIYNGDGTYTAEGPDDIVSLLTDGRFMIDAPSVFYINQDKFTVNSY